MLITDKEQLKQYAADHRVWQGIPGIARTKGGRLFVSLYSGNIKETYGNFVGVIESRDGVRFSEPVAVAFKEGRFRCFDPVLWVDPLDRLWFIWNVMPGEQVMAAICDDPDAEELSWHEPVCIGRGIMMNKPTVLSTGEWLFPIAVWKLDIYREYRAPAYREDDVAGSYVYKTADNGKTFVRLGRADIRDRSFDEHMVIEEDNGNLRMLVRTHYGIGEARSYDRGKTWSRGGDSGLGGPSSRFFIKRLRSGRVLLINHHNFTKRNNLTAFLSEDGGKTFPYTLLLDERKDVSYPDAVEGEDGYIYIVYDRERGGYKSTLEEAYASAREILTARITEQDILSGKLCSDAGYLKRVVCKLSRLAENAPNPFDSVLVEDEEWVDRLITEGGEDLLDRVFEAFSVNCVNMDEFDAKGLDRLVERFRATGMKDKALLLEIVNHMRRVPKKKRDVSPVIETAKARIAQRLCEELSVAELAESMNISVHYLAHLFRSFTGTTLTAYRNELRLTRAKQLLVSSTLTVGEIAARTGFSTAAYFTEVFTASESIPPSEYRKYHARA